jgi:aryl-alcohol dehydrogenase-like predicted oxidoreductase
MDDLVAGCSARRALQLTRSAPGLVTVLIGIKQPNYVRQNLELCKRPLLEMK